jgi:hypothetical protein
MQCTGILPRNSSAWALAFVAAIGLSHSLPCAAQLRLDQSFTSPFNMSANINECCDFVGQTYTAGKTGVLTGVSVDVSSQSVYQLHVAIRTVEGGLPTTTVLGEVTLGSNASDLSQVIVFPQSVPQVAGTQYAIVVNYPDAPPPGGGQLQGDWLGATGNVYGSGDLVLSSDGGESFFTLGYGDDVHFKTFVSPVTELSLRANPNPNPPVQWGLLTYAFRLTNQVAASHQVLTTQVPVGTVFSSIAISGTAGRGSCNTPEVGASGPVVCQQPNLMRPGKIWRIAMTVQITAPAGTTLTETATASSDNLGSADATLHTAVH